MVQSRGLVFVVDDEKDNLELVVRSLRNFDVRTFSDPTLVVEAALAARPAVLVVDYRMPVLDGRLTRW